MENTREKYDDLIRGVLDGLGKTEVQTPAESEKPMKNECLLVLLCGGLTGAQEAAEQLRKLDQAGYQMDVMFTEAGKGVLGERWLKAEQLGNLKVIDNLADGFVSLNNAHAVVVPVMTVNTASKVLNGIADNAVTSAIMHGLLQGKPVIAAKDACDVAKLSNLRQMKEPLYYATLAANIPCLEQFGIDMVPVGGLTECVEKTFAPDLTAVYGVPEAAAPAETQKPQIREDTFVFSGRVLSAPDVMRCNADVIQLSGKVLVTPAAADRAAERNIRIVTV